MLRHLKWKTIITTSHSDDKKLNRRVMVPKYLVVVGFLSMLTTMCLHVTLLLFSLSFCDICAIVFSFFTFRSARHLDGKHAVFGRFVFSVYVCVCVCAHVYVCVCVACFYSFHVGYRTQDVQHVELI